jgi:hypothetical protein
MQSSSKTKESEQYSQIAKYPSSKKVDEIYNLNYIQPADEPDIYIGPAPQGSCKFKVFTSRRFILSFAPMPHCTIFVNHFFTTMCQLTFTLSQVEIFVPAA